jgi:L-ascorbate metabolism protein UlaG (beta-lactamase superfamily)
VRNSDHFNGRTFFNPSGANGQPLRQVPRMLRENGTPWPSRVSVQQRRPFSIDGSRAVVTFIGHATFLIQTKHGNVLTDPVYSERASPVSFAGPRRVRMPAVSFDALPPVSLVLLSHNHYDHCDLRTLDAIEQAFHPLVVTPLGNGRLLKSAGVRRIEELDWWQDSATSPIPVRVTAAQHFSARTPFDRNRALWGGFMLTIDGRRLFFAGDSGYGRHFVEVRERCRSPDLALLPIGAYEPRWFMKDIHMNPAEAVQAHLDLGAAQSIGMHFGTFQLTTEGIDAPLIALDTARREHRVADTAFRTLDFGESLRIE